MAQATGVWVVMIHHRHGANVYVTTTEAKANEIVREYVDDEWPMEIADTPKPADPMEMVRQYFEENEDEYADIQFVEVK